MSRPRKGAPWLWPSTRGPSLSDMPKRIVICLAVWVTFSRSLAAPVVISSKDDLLGARRRGGGEFPGRGVGGWIDGTARRAGGAGGRLRGLPGAGRPQAREGAGGG